MYYAKFLNFGHGFFQNGNITNCIWSGRLYFIFEKIHVQSPGRVKITHLVHICFNQGQIICP